MAFQGDVGPFVGLLQADRVDVQDAMRQVWIVGGFADVDQQLVAFGVDAAEGLIDDGVDLADVRRAHVHRHQGAFVEMAEAAEERPPFVHRNVASMHGNLRPIIRHRRWYARL